MKWLSLLFLLGLDIVSKMGAITWIPPMSGGAYPFGGVGVFSDFLGISFSLNFVVNTGAAWGLFPGYPGLLFAIRVAIISGLILYLLRSKKSKQISIPLWLVIVGAVGNAIDFALYGHVIDFFHFNFWGYSFPVFNFADSYISIGVLYLVLFESFNRPSSAPLNQSSKPA